MIQGGKDLLIIGLAGLCLLLSLFLLPWAELGFNGAFPPWLLGVMQWLGVVALFDWLGKEPFAIQIHEFLTKQGACNFGDYAYSLFLFAALVAAAVAIILIGREDSEEKLLLPAKK
jgi:hypothetical protein